MKILGFKLPTELITFIFGVLISFAVFSIKWAYVTKKFYDFKAMLDREYILKDNFSGVSSEVVTTEYENNVQRIDYLIKNEISNINYINQFKFIRIAEFTKMYCLESLEVISQYSFGNLDNSGIEIQLKELRALQIVIPKIKQLYVDRRDDYVSMKRDRFMENKEMIELKKEYMDILAS